MDTHARTLLHIQAWAYALVLIFWVLPIPNPVKMVAVTFHEISHGVAALATGGRVFGYAVSPSGAGVTFGVGGNFPAILLAGYIGSCIWGTLLYMASVYWRPVSCLLAVQIVIIASAYIGWLTNATMFFGVISIGAMTGILWTPLWVQTLFIRVLGSTCCLYAPLEVLGEFVDTGGAAPKILGMSAASDLAQISTYYDISPVFVGVTIVTLQAVLVVSLIHWTCNAGARAELTREIEIKRTVNRRKHDLEVFQRPVSHHGKGNLFR